MDPCSWHIRFNDDAAMLNAPRYIGISAQKQIDSMKRWDIRL